MNNSKFRSGSGVYTCIICKKQTRETGDNESSVQMCADCYEWESMQNQHSDDGHEGAMNECAECMDQMSRPANIAKRATAPDPVAALEKIDALMVMCERDQLTDWADFGARVYLLRDEIRAALNAKK